MRKISLFALALATAQLHGHNYSCPTSDLVFKAEYAYLNRGEIRDLPLVKKRTIPTDGFISLLGGGETIFDTEDLLESLDSQSAIRGSVIYKPSICSSLELLYTYVLPWNTKKTITHPGLLSYPFKDFMPLRGFINADQVVSKYRSRLQNGEFNYWIHVTPQYVNYFSFSWDLGLRYIFLRERFSIEFIKPNSVARYSANTKNELYGIQLGGMFEINLTSCWTWSFMLKGAAFANQVKNDVSVIDPTDANVPPSFSKSKLTSTGLIEAYGQLAYNIYSFFSVHAGYQGYLLFGLALAPEQRGLSSNRITCLKSSGQIVIHGLYAGASLRF